MRRAPVARSSSISLSVITVAVIAVALIVSPVGLGPTASGSSVATAALGDPSAVLVVPATSHPNTSLTVTAAGDPGDPADPVERPPITVNPFMPAERSLSDCLSVVPRPGCGSEARGGPYQAAVFGAIVVGLGIIITRIVIGVRRNRPADPSTPA